jgi:hypothetical protein
MSGAVYSTFLGTPGLRAGLATLEIDGEIFDVVGDLAYDATVLTREGLIGQSGTQGFSEMAKYGTISAQLRDSGNLTVSAIKLKTASSVTAVMANGKTVQGANMFCTECTAVATMEGTFSVTFMGTVTEDPTS